MHRSAVTDTNEKERSALGGRAVEKRASLNKHAATPTYETDTCRRDWSMHRLSSPPPWRNQMK